MGIVRPFLQCNRGALAHIKCDALGSTSSVSESLAGSADAKADSLRYLVDSDAIMLHLIWVGFGSGHSSVACRRPRPARKSSAVVRWLIPARWK
jgi:hypothetical protein